MKDYARSFYNSKKWRTTQRAYMVSQHYVCERCGGVARIVHHRKHITPGNIVDLAVTLDWKNLEAVCLECHNGAHGSGPACADGLRFDGGGNLVPATDAPHLRD